MCRQLDTQGSTVARSRGGRAVSSNVAVGLGVEAEAEVFLDQDNSMFFELLSFRLQGSDVAYLDINLAKVAMWLYVSRYETYC
jgi:hypothetical protein